MRLKKKDGTYYVHLKMLEDAFLKAVEEGDGKKMARLNNEWEEFENRYEREDEEFAVE